jgi:hypothetical protein
MICYWITLRERGRGGQGYENDHAAWQHARGGSGRRVGRPISGSNSQRGKGDVPGHVAFLLPNVGSAGLAATFWSRSTRERISAPALIAVHSASSLRRSSQQASVAAPHNGAGSGAKSSSDGRARRASQVP